MFTVRNQQRAALARAQTGAFLVGDFLAAGAATASYDAARAEVLVADVPGQPARVSIDGEGRITRVATPLGRAATYQFAGDHLAATTTTAGFTTRYAVDGLGRLATVARQSGRQYAFGYDPTGRLASVRFPDRTTIRAVHAPDGKPTRLTDEAGHDLRWDYDDRQRLVRATDARGGQTTFGYGPGDRPTTIAHPDGHVERVAYGPTGRPAAIGVDDAGFATFAVDDAGRTTDVRFADGRFLAFRFEGGRIKAGANPDVRVDYEYDARGRLTAEVQAGVRVEHRYGADGRREALTLTAGDAVRYAHDADGRVTAITDWAGAVHRFTYGDHDVAAEHHRPNGVTEAFEFDELSRPVRITVTGPAGTPVWGEAYNRDASDRIASVVDGGGGGARSLQYDAVGRVTGEAVSRPGVGPRVTERLARDAGGNVILRNGRPFAYGRASVLLGSGEDRRYEYDARGNRVADVGPAGTWRYDYDHQNLMIRCVRPDGSAVRFTYDAFARRLTKSAGGVTTRYLWAGHQLVRETREEVGRPAASTDYLYFPGTDRLLALRVGRAVYHCHCDQLGTPRRLTDAAGVVRWSADPDLFGRVPPPPGPHASPPVENPWRFPGQYADAETGLHYSRARYYDPETGVYLSRDPAALVAGSGWANPYAYCDGDPVHATDPFGLLFGETWPGWVKTTLTVGAGIAVGVGAVLAAPVILTGLAAVGITGAVATGIVVIGGGAAAGAAGGFMGAAMTKGGCILCGMGKGALVGGLASIPALFLPAAAGVAAVLGGGGLSGGVGYALDHAIGGQPWSSKDFLVNVAAGVATAGLGRFLHGAVGRREAALVEEPVPAPGSDSLVSTPVENAQIADHAGDRGSPIESPTGSDEISRMGERPVPGSRTITQDQNLQSDQYWRSRDTAEAYDGHGHDRHGAQTTMDEQTLRVQSGEAPDGNFAPTDKATRFDSHAAEVEAVERANAQDPGAGVKKFTRNGLPNRTAKVVADGPEGYGEGVQVQTDADGDPLPDRPVQPTGRQPNAKVIYQYNPDSDSWEPLTQYPTDEPTTP